MCAKVFICQKKDLLEECRRANKGHLKKKGKKCGCCSASGAVICKVIGVVYGLG